MVGNVISLYPANQTVLSISVQKLTVRTHVPCSFLRKFVWLSWNVNATVKIFVATRKTVERDVCLSTILVYHRNTFRRHTNKLNRKQNLLNAIFYFSRRWTGLPEPYPCQLEPVDNRLCLSGSRKSLWITLVFLLKVHKKPVLLTMLSSTLILKTELLRIRLFSFLFLHSTITDFMHENISPRRNILVINWLPYKGVRAPN